MQSVSEKVIVRLSSVILNNKGSEEKLELIREAQDEFQNKSNNKII